MSDNSWLARVITEAEELEAKLKKLTIYIDSSDAFQALNEENRSLLNEQRHHMSAYLSILQRRIKLNS